MRAMQTLAPDSFCPLTNPQPYQREQAQPPLWERGCAPTENILIKIDMDAQRQRAVGWSDWLGLVGSAEYIAFFVIEECVHGEQLLLKLKVRVPRLKPPGSKSAVNDIA